MNRKSKNRNILNSIRITLLDWDPMDLFLMGQAGLEEYDEYLVQISDKMKTCKNVDEMKVFLFELARDEMDVEADLERTQIAAQKLIDLNLE
jgi:hypothetical protein